MFSLGELQAEVEEGGAACRAPVGPEVELLAFRFGVVLGEEGRNSFAVCIDVVGVSAPSEDTRATRSCRVS